jgi:uncharacterized repeat protein (TIGR03803 family)
MKIKPFLLTLFLGLCSSMNLVAPPSPVVYTTVASFNDTFGSVSEGTLLRGADGNYYGTTMNGGAYGLGSVFKVTLFGKIIALASFNGTNGASPQAGLILGGDGNFYGTTIYGGRNGVGTVFKLTPGGKLTTLVSFNYGNGANPYAGLVQGNDGNFYGTTLYGGQADFGTVFKLTPTGILTTLVSFNGLNGMNPQAALVQGDDGNFYGTTVQGGANFNTESFTGWGTVFKMTPYGSLTTLASFGGTNGANPLSALTPAVGGQFYGTTMSGGIGFADDNYTGNGTIFKIGQNGRLTTLHYFTGYPDEGSQPELGKLIVDLAGNVFGTTYGGGQNGSGSIFRLSRLGQFKTVYSFQDDTGSQPVVGLTSSGAPITFYGTTTYGGQFGQGTIFKVIIWP